MKLAKRVVLFVTVNILILATVSIVLNLLGVQPYLDARGIRYESLLIFCAVWGFGGAFVSLALSRIMAKWMMGVKVISDQETDPALRSLMNRVHELARKADLKAMPEVGVYEADDLNAFATGPTQSRSLVAVSTGLLRSMNRAEVDGVLAHEVAHIANGDMVTMTLVQGVVNTFVMFLARVASFFASQFVAEERRSLVQFIVTIGLEIVLGILGMIVVGAYSRAREFRADAGAARLSSRENMIAALKCLRDHQFLSPSSDPQPSLATMKISGKKGGGLFRLFSTHPDLSERILRLERGAY